MKEITVSFSGDDITIEKMEKQVDEMVGCFYGDFWGMFVKLESASQVINMAIQKLKNKYSDQFVRLKKEKVEKFGVVLEYENGGLKVTIPEVEKIKNLSKKEIYKVKEIKAHYKNELNDMIKRFKISDFSRVDDLTSFLEEENLEYFIESFNFEDLGALLNKAKELSKGK